MTPFELRLEIIKFSYEYLRNTKHTAPLSLPQNEISVDDIIEVAKKIYKFVDVYKDL